MKLYTIGFSKKSAEQFFNLLTKNKVKKIIDVRLNHNSQISGFAKSEDLRFFLKLFSIDYVHVPEFTPTKEILKAYRNKVISWEEYEERFLELLEKRKERIEKRLENLDLENACLLCSEDKPHRCHRRLVAEYLKENFIPSLEVHHL